MGTSSGVAEVLLCQSISTVAEHYFQQWMLVTSEKPKLVTERSLFSDKSVIKGLESIFFLHADFQKITREQ